MKRYLLDTNILIYYWKGDIPKGEMKHVEEILKHSFIISIITNLAEFTIDLKRNNNIKLADALIAATALSNELVLVTRNEDHFSILTNLEIYNPFNADS